MEEDAAFPYALYPQEGSPIKLRVVSINPFSEVVSYRPEDGGEIEQIWVIRQTQPLTL